MLINFRVENFKSFKNETNLSMYASKMNDYINTHTFSTVNEKNRLLRSAVIFGPNGSGKSNLITAMSFMRKYVELSASYTEAREDLENEIKAFKLNSESENMPSSFEVIFIIDNVRYRYGFVVDKYKVWNEWLYHKSNIKETPLFIREGQNISYINSLFSEGNVIKKENMTRENALFLSVVAQFNGNISLKIVHWFEKFNVTSNVGRNRFDHITLDMLSKSEDRKRIIKLIKAADVGIYSILMHDEPMNLDNLSKGFKEFILKKEKKIPTQTIIETQHIKYGPNKEYLGTINFDFHEESIGTQKLIMLAGAIIETLMKGEVLVIDELDNSFHTLLTKFVVDLFHNSLINRHNAQLIFITHDTNILSQEYFRRDQIWFAEKNLYGESILTPLLDFGIRKDTVLEKNYLQGNYGGLPKLSSELEDIFIESN